jgi:hypothetical protein
MHCAVRGATWQTPCPAPAGRCPPPQAGSTLLFPHSIQLLIARIARMGGYPGIISAGQSSCVVFPLRRGASLLRMTPGPNVG